MKNLNLATLALALNHSTSVVGLPRMRTFDVPFTQADLDWFRKPLNTSSVRSER